MSFTNTEQPGLEWPSVPQTARSRQQSDAALLRVHPSLQPTQYLQIILGDALLPDFHGTAAVRGTVNR